MKAIKYIVMPIVLACPASVLHAQTVGGLVGVPIVSVGNLVTGVGGIHHTSLAPIVKAGVPSVTNAADGVSYALEDVGTGVARSGAQIQRQGISVGGTPDGGAPLISIGAASDAKEGSVIAILNAKR